MLVWSAKPSMSPGLPGWVIRHRTGVPPAGGAGVATPLGGVGAGVAVGVFAGAVHETARTSRTQRDPTGPSARHGITTPAVCTLARNFSATQRTRTTWVAHPNATATSRPRTSGRLARCVHNSGHHRAHRPGDDSRSCASRGSAASRWLPSVWGTPAAQKCYENARPPMGTFLWGLDPRRGEFGESVEHGDGHSSGWWPSRSGSGLCQWGIGDRDGPGRWSSTSCPVAPSMIQVLCRGEDGQRNRHAATIRSATEGAVPPEIGQAQLIPTGRIRMPVACPSPRGR